MNKFKTMISAACSLVLLSVSAPVVADSGNFAGPYVAISASGYGVQLSGESISSSSELNQTVTAIDEVSVGKVALVTGFEAGYAIPVGSMFLLDIGAAYHTGAAKLDYISDDTSGSFDEITFTIDGLKTGYIAPTIVLSDTSSLFVKVGLTEADVVTTGDITPPADLSGTTWTIGTRTVLSSGIFIRTEAGYTDYNGISSHGKGTTRVATTSYSAEPTIAFGAISLGFRF